MKVFETFSGFGGWSYGLKKAKIDFEVVGISEVDKYAIQCYNQNFPNIKNLNHNKMVVIPEIPQEVRK